ncbi:phytanoyl-CoA dioxygenase family protein [Bosea sp. BK604]|uniref:phytanoyl-CoA dioxygenase family protein n=1 Tax=Bosea sp. BK604 TaxID=2512180 RepID=UPI00104653F6|nr:phytanoyl-CoA dioxygenase family protein [Bosea sp. BK604]TCR69995.1 phytanoyl-CoA dioxygenase PhyH [Bosea sp. BK604]
MSDEAFPRYGVREQTLSETAVDHAIEQLRLLGYAIVDGGYSSAELVQLSQKFDAAKGQMEERFGRDNLVAIDEHNTVRVPMVYDRTFLDLARNPVVVEICRRLMGEAFLLNQQNGVINPGRAQRYNQSAYHRDLPYQHYVSSRPLAINALFCIDPFTLENGATHVVPGSHKQEAFPSDTIVKALEVQAVAPAGSFIVLDCMVYHAGGVNRTETPRRAVNHVYTIPMMKQQVDMPTVLGDDFTQDPYERKLLGYDYQVPVNVEAYYAQRRAKSAK